MTSKTQLAERHDTYAKLVELHTTAGTNYTVSKGGNQPLFLPPYGYLSDLVTSVTLSYAMPIGATVDGIGYRNVTKYSRTTSRHQNRVCASVGLYGTDFINLLVRGVHNG
jgi:hypothetical protein